jgi:hypothetical protein
VIANAQAFIAAGGRAQWNYIVFRHNEHQVEQAKQLANSMRFHNILIRKTGRFLNHETMEEIHAWPVKNSNQLLEPPENPEYRNTSMMFLPNLKKQYASVKEYFDSTPIQCDAMIGRKVAINAEGVVLPCNFFNHNLYDARFYNNAQPGAHALANVNGNNQVRTFLETHGLDNLNINYRSLQEIFNNAFWQDLVESWSNSNRLFECAMTCGSKLTKVWDQGGSR